ncbi:hypothetical protein MTX20_37360 [Bradyrhizobium sp. ISRA435]|nr:hypothetical protein MTX20_37360 [Bradyrhizobium sp. ISRA435]
MIVKGDELIANPMTERYGLGNGQSTERATSSERDIDIFIVADSAAPHSMDGRLLLSSTTGSPSN